MPRHPKNSLLPSFRRSTFRAPDPDAVRAFDRSLPDVPGESVGVRDGRSSAVAAVLADLDLPDAPERPLRRRSTALPIPRHEDPLAPAAEPEGDLAGPADTARPAELPPAPAVVRDASSPTPHPRHRADRIGNRRPSSGVRRAILVGCAAAMLGGTLVTGVTVAGADRDAAAAASGARDDAIRAAASGDPEGDVLASEIDAVRPVVTGGPSTGEAPFTGGTEVTVEGRNLDQVAAVTVAGEPARVVEATAEAITFAVPAVDDAVRGDAEVELTDEAGNPVVVDAASVPSAPATAAAELMGPTAVAQAGVADAIGTTGAPLTIAYTSDPGIDAQVAYVLAHWSSYNSAAYPVLGGVDCANFASQSLVARGWSMDGAWYYDAGTGRMSPAWSSSTALRDYLRTQPARATELTDAHRDQVKVGDLAQFDWDGSGDRDHTAIVTRVEHTDQGTRVWVGGHTKDIDYWDVDEALASGGGTVTHFSLR
ncbi:amidase domain-containing protein [Agromyces aurantiacus]|uniref:Amidase domain-containing protein n=1 Tax=Agromyces aurantiacus TaxID=165814 RepID=A0ABV9R2Y7_9MICO|nr:amidase domain-containing protein [Agromyces aurantiacus]MBM7503175.1 hypothetical protein [Agromyces aurantiacus]